MMALFIFIPYTEHKFLCTFCGHNTFHDKKKKTVHTTIKNSLRSQDRRQLLSEKKKRLTQSDIKTVIKL